MSTGNNRPSSNLRHRIQRRARAALLLPILAGLAFVACRDASQVVPLGSAYGQVELAEPLVLVPDFRWREHRDGGKWFFGTYARLLCVVREATSPLEILLVPDPETTLRHYTVEWDGESLLEEAVQPPAEGLRLVIPVEKLGPGRHELYVRRQYRPSKSPVVRSHDNSFLRLAYRFGAEEKEISLGKLETYRQVASFLRQGGMGDGREQRDGIMMLGSAEHALELALPSSGRFRIEPWNHSKAAARFELRQGDKVEGVTLGPGKAGALALDLGPGQQRLTLAAEGEDIGPFLWALPRVEPGASASLVPIVVITLDTTRRDALGAYGAPAGLTPNLDTLAKRATVFEEAFSTSPWTLPSHASIFTGLYPSRHKAGVSEAQLSTEASTLARLLREAGYFTAGFSSGELSSSRFGLGLGFNYYRNPDGFETKGGELASHLNGFLDTFGAQPLFLFVNVFDAHAVYEAPDSFAARLGLAELASPLAGQPIWEELAAGDGTVWQRVVDGEAEVSPEALSFLRAAYLAEVAFADHVVGQLFDRLRSLGLFERALIVVTADHGELLGEGGFFSHSVRLDPELVEIPLIVKWPGQNSGHRVPGLVSLVDLYPTILEAAGLTPPASDGRSLGLDRTPAHPFVFLEEHESLVHPLIGHMRIAGHLFGVQKAHFRQVVWAEDQQCQRREGGLWAGVPCQTERGVVLDQIQEALDPPEASDAPQTEWMSPEMKRRLEALGYL